MFGNEHLRSGNTWEVEDFGVLPVQMMGLRASGSVPIRKKMNLEIQAAQ